MRVLILVAALAFTPSCALGQVPTGQEESRGGIWTGLVVGTAASSIAMTGFCTGAGYLVANGKAFIGGSTAGFCPVWGVLYGIVPALGAGLGLSYPDRRTLKGRFRTMGLGVAGGVALSALMLAMGVENPGDGFLAAAGWGAGLGLVTAVVGPGVQGFLFPSPAPPEAPSASRLALGLAVRVQLP